MATLSVPSQVPPVAEDCEQLRKAFEGWGTDEAKIITILAHRNAGQRCLIRKTYAETYGEDLLTALRKEISSDFERAVLLWILHPSERDALLANEAIKKGNVGHYILMEIACSRTSRGLFDAREDYHSRFKKSLEEDVAHHTDRDFRKLLVPLLTSHRYEGGEVDMTLAASEAEILHEKISANACSHDEVIRIITTRSKAQINATLKHYNESFGDVINKGLKPEAKDEYLALLRATITCLTNPEKYFEEVLRKSIMKLGTDEEALTRVVVTRAEFDLERIKEEYHRRNNVTLYSAIEGDTSGDYRSMLLALVGEDGA